jgi:Cu(I)/Ag(I) efflux system membrane fusion protein
MPRSFSRLALAAALFAAGAAGGVVLGARYGATLGLVVGAPAPGNDAAPVPARRKVLYYKNPMGLPDTSPVPKKDSMGMDYLPVYEGEDEDGSVVKVSPDRIQKLGVRTEAAAKRALMRTIRATGTVQFDEARQVVVTARADGWIENLHVARTGDRVHKGEVLADLYSPELVKAQIDQFIGRRAGERDLEGPLFRLRNFGIAEEDIERIRRDGRASRTVPLRSPVSGIVVEKRVVEGMRAAPGELLFRIVDPSIVWVVADIYEQDIGLAAQGQAARVAFTAFPGRAFAGTVTIVYPTIAAATRTGRVRIDVANPDGALKADMFATAEIEAAAAAEALAIPESAVIDSGLRRIALVEKGGGRFEPRAIKTGIAGDGYVAVLEGIAEGEKVVVAANFLIDAESNLKSALRGLAPPAPPAGEKPEEKRP